MGTFFYSPRREIFEELEKFIVLNEQLDWSRLRKLWELEGLSDQHFFCTTQAFFHNDKKTTNLKSEPIPPPTICANVYTFAQNEILEHVTKTIFLVGVWSSYSAVSKYSPALLIHKV